MGKFFIRLYNYFDSHRIIYFVILLLLFASTIFFSFKINLEEDISRILPKDKKIEKLNDVFQNSHFLDKLVITVYSSDTTLQAQPDSLVAYADELVSELE